ncbi:hypothetical protein [Nocardia nova]|uniref:hypothetical protein n=1 Tax=Nocardia nova TaxID=37330 RepID=UPI001FE778FA|nr:hypothetical protein [Nocardia nova]
MLDDHFVHSTPYPISAVGAVPSRDPRFFERHWNVWHDDVGDLLVATGGSWYRNLGMVESYAIVNFRGDHRSVRALRPARSSNEDLCAGPLQPTIVEGLRHWRHIVEPGEWGFSFDLSWTDSHRQVYGAAWGPEPKVGEREVTAGFESFGVVTGWIQVGGTRIQWEPGHAHGTRDRHWGIGRGVGGPRLNHGRTHRSGWKGGMWIDLGDVGVWGKRLLYRHGDQRPGASTVEKVDRRLKFEPQTHVFVSGSVDLTFDDGTVRRLQLERFGHQTAYMRCGFYGGTPDGGLHHGEYNGPERVEWDRFDVTDPAVRKRLRGLDEHHCRVIEGGRTTTGILQPLEPDAYHACIEGKPGWRFSDDA